MNSINIVPLSYLEAQPIERSSTPKTDLQVRFGGCGVIGVTPLRADGFLPKKSRRQCLLIPKFKIFRAKKCNLKLYLEMNLILFGNILTFINSPAQSKSNKFFNKKRSAYHAQSKFIFRIFLIYTDDLLAFANYI